MTSGNDTERVREPDKFGIGMKEDGSVKVLTPEEAARSAAFRDAEENDENDLSDLDDIEGIVGK